MDAWREIGLGGGSGGGRREAPSRDGAADAAFERALRTGHALPAGPSRTVPHLCGYLPGRIARTEMRPVASLSPDGYQAALEAGYRRFGEVLFRPRCPGCDLCIPVRVLAERFPWRRRWRRALRRNADVRAVVGPARADRDAVRVANAFHAHRARRKPWSPSRFDLAAYHRELCAGPFAGQEVRYYRGDTLLGVGLFDDLPDGETAVLFHYIERWLPDSPGVFNILWLIERALARGCPHVYLGYYVPGSIATAYKAEFQPAEMLRGGAWRPMPERYDPSGA